MKATTRVSLKIETLLCEYRENPIGIDTLEPRLSWRMVSNRRGAAQTAYQIRVFHVDPDGTERPVWDTDRIVSGQSIHVSYAGLELRAMQRYRWEVRVWDESDQVGPWSKGAFWEMGRVDVEWTADWISPPLEDHPTVSQPSPLLRRSFELRPNIQTARLYISALGLYEAHLNGVRVGDHLFTPGWTSYEHRLQYQVYDVKDHLRQGDNVFGALLGNGWYRGPLTWEMRSNFYGDRLALLAEIHVTYGDGGREVIRSDEHWRTDTGPVLMSDIYLGEAYDATRRQIGWTNPGFDDSDWNTVDVIQHARDILIGQVGPPVRKIEQIEPVAILFDPNGTPIVDFGQNMVGWVRLRVTGQAGDTVVLRHGEILDSDGFLYTTNLREATQEVQYTISGVGEEVFEPHFTFQGFRYVLVNGYPGELTLDSLDGVVIHSETKETGRFSCSNSDINQLVSNIRWSQKGNFLELPTDCPQRSERLGWTGDAQVFVETAAYNMDVASFFTKWLGDLAADQKQDGSVPHVIPDVVSKPEEYRGGATGWADAAVIVPWIVYQMYGDERILEQQYVSMTAWIACMRRRAGEDLILREGEHFGDWLSYRSNDHKRPSGPTDPELLATAYFAYSTRLVADIARILGRMSDVAAYDALANRVRDAFIREFVTAGGRLSPNTQTAYVIALAFDLVPGGLIEVAAERLVAEIRRFDNHLTTGFLGTPLLLHVLTAIGRDDVAYDLLMQDTYPSWLYPVKQGATTIWEHWDGIKPDGSLQDPGMNSYNHYAYGAVGSWLYGRVAGIRPDPSEPGFRHVLIQPAPGGGLTFAEAELETMYGSVRSSWAIEDGQFRLRVSVPPNAHATVTLPCSRVADVSESGYPLADVDELIVTSEPDTAVVVKLLSGDYDFIMPQGATSPRTSDL